MTLYICGGRRFAGVPIPEPALFVQPISESGLRPQRPEEFNDAYRIRDTGPPRKIHQASAARIRRFMARFPADRYMTNAELGPFTFQPTSDAPEQVMRWHDMSLVGHVRHVVLTQKRVWIGNYQSYPRPSVIGDEDAMADHDWRSWVACGEPPNWLFPLPRGPVTGRWVTHLGRILDRCRRLSQQAEARGGSVRPCPYIRPESVDEAVQRMAALRRVVARVPMNVILAPGWLPIAADQERVVEHFVTTMEAAQT